MKNILNNVSIKSKIYILVLLPILVILYLHYLEINDKIILKNDAQKIENITIINSNLASFIDELQIERGLNGSFIASKKSLFKDKIQKQIIATDISYSILLKSFQQLKTDSLIELKEFLISFYTELQFIRKETENGKLHENELISFYAINIEAFLDFIYTSGNETTDIGLSRMMLSYSKFLFAKEKNGLERVLVTSLLINSKVTLKDKLKLNNLIVLREQNLDYFYKLLDDDKLKDQYDKNTYLNNQLKIKVIEKKFLKSFNLPNITPNKWFNLMSEWIEIQDSFSHQFSRKIVDTSSQLKKDIVNDMIFLICISSLLLMCFLILVFYLYREINYGLNNLLSGIASLSKNDLSSYQKISIQSNTELSQIASKFNEMVDELKIKEDNTNKITEDLQESKEKLEKNSKLKSEFLANMSHEIRTPLNAIGGFISILKEDEKDAKKREYFNIINSSSESLLEMINDILDFSKIENSKIVLESREIHLSEELKSITDLFKFKLEEKNIELVLDFAQDLPVNIEVDSLKLKQILTNLLSNAIKFSKEKNKIFFVVKYLDKRLFFKVKDQGIGIAYDKQKIIFDPFLQADNSTTRKYGGTGLGLAISKRFVEALGGFLEIKSEENKGSEFYFSIPTVVLNKSMKKKKILDDSNTVLKGHILLVEDNKANQIFMKVILKKMNLSYEIANDGLEAVSKFENTKYDIILMDENMPNMSGIEATKEILNIEKQLNLTHTPIIALTANALVGDKQRFLDAGMDEYLTKPVNKKELHLKMKNFLFMINSNI